jgi:hypothetical protein
MLYARLGGVLHQAQSHKAFVISPNFVVTGIKSIPLAELPKGAMAILAATLTLPDPDQLLSRTPLGYFGQSWWLSGIGFVKPLPKPFTPFGK